MTKHDLSAAAARPAYLVAEVAADVGVNRATVEPWCRQPEFAAAVKRYRFGWSTRRRAALALMAPDRPGPPLYLREVAAAVGVSRRTLYRWRCAPDFAAAHDAAWGSAHVAPRCRAHGGRACGRAPASLMDDPHIKGRVFRNPGGKGGSRGDTDGVEIEAAEMKVDGVAESFAVAEPAR